MIVAASSDPLALSVVALVVSVAAAVVGALYWNEARRERRREASILVLQRLDVVRPQRACIRTANVGDDVDWSQVDVGIRTCFDEVARAFDTVAQLHHMRVVDDAFIVRFFATTFRDLWLNYGLASYVKWIRENRDGTHYWELVGFAPWMINAAGRHPFYSSSSDWPRIRRSRRSRLLRIRSRARSVIRIGKGSNRLSLIGGGAVVREKILPASLKLNRWAAITVLDVADVVRFDREIRVLAPIGEPEIEHWVTTDDGATIIATPTSSHFAYIRLLAEARKVFAVEKPVCATESELRDLIGNISWLERGFALSLYAQDKALPLAYLFTLLPQLGEYLQTARGPKPTDAVVRERLGALGRLTRGEFRLIEDASYSPSGRLRWSEEPPTLEAFADLCVHPFHLTALTAGVGADVRMTRLDQGFHGPRADELTRRAGAMVRIAPTFLDVVLAAGDREFRIVAAKFAATASSERAVKLEYENGVIICDLDARSLALRVSGESAICVRVKPELLPYEVPLRLFERIVRDRSQPEQDDMLRPDMLRYQLAGLKWWFDVCRAAAMQTIRRLDEPVQLPTKLLDRADNETLSNSFGRR